MDGGLERGRVCKRESQEGMYRSDELVMQCIYITVVVESEFGLWLWGFAQWKSLCLIYTYLLLYTYLTTPTGFIISE